MYEDNPIIIMSDPIDSAFNKAVATMQILSTWSVNDALPTPPAADRIKLYSLYKQANEGDIPDSIEYPNGESTESATDRRKWIAWKAKQGLSKTEAKREYVSYLIDVMKTYGGDSPESLKLLTDLEDAQWQNGNSESYQTQQPSMRRSESPAVSLYRVASSGFNSKVTRPPSRNMSMQNNVKKEVNTTTATKPTNDDFVRWQSEINYMLARISHELEVVRKMKEEQHARPDPQPQNYYIERVMKTVRNIKRSCIEAAVKIYQVGKSITGHAAADSIILILVYGLICMIRQRGEFMKIFISIIRTIRIHVGHRRIATV